MNVENRITVNKNYHSRLGYSCYSLLDIVKALLYLIDHPNFDDVFNEYGTVVNQNDVETNTKRVLAGLCVNGVRYEANTAWCEWALDNGCLRVNESGEYEIMTKKVELVTDQEGGKALDMESEVIAYKILSV